MGGSVIDILNTYTDFYKNIPLENYICNFFCECEVEYYSPLNLALFPSTGNLQEIFLLIFVSPSTQQQHSVELVYSKPSEVIGGNHIFCRTTETNLQSPNQKQSSLLYSDSFLGSRDFMGERSQLWQRYLFLVSILGGKNLQEFSNVTFMLQTLQYFDIENVVRGKEYVQISKNLLNVYIRKVLLASSLSTFLLLLFDIIRGTLN